MLQYFYAFSVFLALVAGCLATDPSDYNPQRSNLTPCNCDTIEPTKTTENSNIGPTDDKLRIRIAEEPPSLLPIIDPVRGTRVITDHDIYESLVRPAADSKEVAPELATSWYVADDFRTYIFELDPRAMWHDGTPLTAEDVAFTFSRVLDPAGGAAIRGEFLEVSDVEAIDNETVKFELDAARPDFLLTLSRVSILPAHVFGQEPLATHPAARAPVGSGPFRFQKWNAGRSIVIERNPEWRGAPPRIKTIEYLIIPHTNVALQLLDRGEIDVVLDLDQSLKLENPDLQILTYPKPEFQYWMFNTRRPYFSTARLRSAVVMLIDRDAIRCSVLACRAEPIESPWPREVSPLLGFATSRAFDPSGAKEILKKSGWLDSDEDGILDHKGDPFSFSLLLPNLQNDLVQAATVVQQDLAALGIQMRITTFTRGAYTRLLRKRKFDATVISVPTNNMYDPWSLFHSEAIGSASNWGGFQSQEIDHLINRLHREWEPLRRNYLMKKISLELLAQHPGNFTFRPFGVALAQDDIQGIRFENGALQKNLLYRSPPKNTRQKGKK